MLKIKLSPTGKKNAKHYRIVVMEEHSKLTSDVVANLGHYHPQENHRIEIDKATYETWIKKGAQPTDKVRRLVK